MSVRNLIKGMLVLYVFVAATPVFAQGQLQPKSPEERAQRQITWMQKNLALTDDQNKKAYDILLRYARETEKTMNTPAGPDKRQERKDIQKNKDADLQSVLTGDQYQKYQAHVQEMKEKMQQRRSGMQDGGN